MLNYLLDQTEVAQALISTDKPEVLEAYVTEILRIDPPIQGVYREAKVNETVGSTSLNPGDLVYCDVAGASMNVSSSIFYLDNDFYGLVDQCVWRTQQVRSLSFQGSLYQQWHFD